ncbi:MAG TPA: deacetylase SIR2 [Jeotgalicoccus aerolatus]|nr:deacetylase SIR2 [Jeotgalicoccus aerolatus]
MEKTSWHVLSNGEYLTASSKLSMALDEADAVLIGVGAGMAAADGFTYAGPRFTQNFPDFIEKYRWLDMFQASVFEFENLNEEWAFFSRFVDLNYMSQPLGESYIRLKELLEGRNYHIITSNADNAFEKAGFDKNKVFDVQGKYNLLQCSKGCTPKRYNNEELMKDMIDRQRGMKVPDDLIPYCKECGAPMELNRRNHTDWMVEDARFFKEQKLYKQFLQEYADKKLLILELGCGYMAPQVIKHPFQNMTENQSNSLYMTVNLKDYSIPQNIRNRTIWLQEDIKDLILNIQQEQQFTKMNFYETEQ